MNRYAFVVRGERKGRVVDRVTGADVSDDASDDTLNRDALSAQDKLDSRASASSRRSKKPRTRATPSRRARGGATSRGGGAGPRESARDVGGSGARRGGEARDAGGERR